ncbi:MAG TPA: large conductance mechanosensitive channel protein MscL [Ornithinimicrobium sp.]|uniref:large conductance mechanosensitive channel protein MscL n=1 Tax=Ornithinimicrobium sp. TaxID=1977084 RepID=UPI002B488150|nr:large conductance mechanosensitive channel protein MscL [Ornithinimicrobium sp.]HKJ13196.1 large conductance mechanosensitive channel protein MscL [Ornithinimicrobium sp.]
MLQGFKEFIMRGNIVDLAVAVVIGTAFAAVVDTVVSSLISPMLARVGGADVGAFGIQLGAEGNMATLINIGAIINALIIFMLTAAVVYFIVVVPMNKLTAVRRTEDEPDVDEASEEVLLLTEIRDLLRQRDVQA